MKYVKPIELANTCAVFAMLRTNILSRRALEAAVSKVLCLDSTLGPREIVQACCEAGLVAPRGDRVSLSSRGKAVVKCHRQVEAKLGIPAKNAMLDEVYLNPEAGEACCAPLLLLFRVDQRLGTFIYLRSPEEPPNTLLWLYTLGSVGLLDVLHGCAAIRKEYLPRVNSLLSIVRSHNVGIQTIPDQSRSEVGNIAEEAALRFERKRLTSAGYPELAALVSRISLVDTAAGYDLVSYRGGKRQADSQIFIEVKGTRSRSRSFIWTANERSVAKREGPRYWIYIYTGVSLESGEVRGPTRIRDPAATLDSLGYHIEPLDVLVSDQAQGRYT